MSGIIENPDEILYLVSLRPHEGYEEKFEEWYNTVHIPELLSCPGFLAAWRYKLVRDDLSGAPEFLAIYRMSGWDAFESEEYLALKARSQDELQPLDREMRPHRDALINAKYAEVFSAEGARV